MRPARRLARINGPDGRAAAAAAQQQKALALASLHDDALNLLAEVVEIPQYGLVVTENVCFHTKVPIVAFESLIDASGTNATIKARIAYYYTTKHVSE